MLKRRTLVRSIPVGLATSASVLTVHAAGRSATAQAQHPSPHASNGVSAHTYQWALLYWMPYDNDLARFGESILSMLTRGTHGSDVLVAVQSDLKGEQTMQRQYMVDGVMTRVEGSPEGETTSLSEDSSDEAALSAYLQWAKDTFRAKHWTVIIVGHGGRINQISPDDHTALNANSEALEYPRTWMGIDVLAKAVSHFNQSLQDSEQGQVDLLFFQNCNKATLEVLYEARHCARYTLASQFALGAPNFYYEEVLQTLGQLPQDEAGTEVITDGYGAALAIMGSEAPNMYQTLTLVDNQAIAQLPTHLAPLLQVLQENSATIDLMELPIYRYFGERHCDFLALLEQAVAASGHGTAELQAFSSFMVSSVISHCATEGHLYGSGALMRSQPDRFCGIGLYCPVEDGDDQRYQSLALAQDVDLQHLYNKIV